MFNDPKPFLISIVGPTGVGKTTLSLLLASHFETEIISADSRQMFRGLDIGTAKPSAEELAKVPHHLIDWLEPTQDLNVQIFREQAVGIIQELFRQHQVLIVVGGSTLYMEALWFGLNDMPAIPQDIRSRLNKEFKEQGLEALQQELEEVDPVTWASVDRNNHARIIRALEVYRTTGIPISTFRAAAISKEDHWQHLKIALTDDRAVLYDRINKRVDAMIEAGLESEIKGLLDSGLPPECQALRSIGYQEWVGYFQGKYDRDEAIRLHKRNSRRYAKRQLTWYRRYEDVTWFEAGKPEHILRWVTNQMPPDSFHPNG